MAYRLGDEAPRLVEMLAFPPLFAGVVSLVACACIQVEASYLKQLPTYIAHLFVHT